MPQKPTPTKILRILWLIPGKENSSNSMCFVKRKLALMQRRPELQIEAFFLGSRKTPIYLYRKLKALGLILKRFAPHLIHAQYGTLTGAFGAVIFGYPLIISYRGSDLNPAPGTHWARNLFGHLLSQISAYRASHVIFVSERLQQRLWRGNVPTKIIPSGVDLALFSPISRKQARSKLEWDHDDPVVLFYAGSDPIGKGLDLANAAISHALKNVPNLRFQVLNGGVPSHIMPLYYGASDCLLMTSMYEGSPNVVKEAMACNLPVVAVDVGDVQERLDGVLPSEVTLRDPSLLGAAVAEITKTCHRSTGRDRTQQFDQRVLADQLVKIYRELQ